ncbi:hypothetical protein DUW70_01220 [Stenotrophomonas maltophilia]|nr:hypothetical protein DUW70_01220 [Stenotrophomonas maltophilia]
MESDRDRIFRTFIEAHPRMAWIYRVDQGRHPPTAACRPTVSTHHQPRETVEGGVGPVAGA